MKPYIVLTLILVVVTAARAQDDDTLQFVHGLPLTGEDTVQATPQQDLAPTDSIVNLSAEQIPTPLYKELDDGPQYRGWRKGLLQLDRNTGLYWIHIDDGKVRRSYGFSKDGKPVSVNEKNISE